MSFQLPSVTPKKHLPRSGVSGVDNQHFLNTHTQAPVHHRQLIHSHSCLDSGLSRLKYALSIVFKQAACRSSAARWSQGSQNSSTTAQVQQQVSRAASALASCPNFLCVCLCGCACDSLRSHSVTMSAQGSWDENTQTRLQQ